MNNRRNQADRRRYIRNYERRVTGGLPYHTPEIALGAVVLAWAGILFALFV